MATPALPVTARIASDQRRAMEQGRSMTANENHGDTTLQTQDQVQEAKYVIFVYNILDKEYVVNAAPKFPAFRIPACPKGDKFSYTLLPAFTKERFNVPGTTEFYYRTMDGRKDATTLLNPSAFPGTAWEAQLQQWNTGDQFNNNLNAFGVFWSLTSPDEEEKLEQEIALFKDRVRDTMNALIREAELLAAQGSLRDITPNMHFAMDYLGKQAQWHMTTDHMVSCPNCGATIKDGIAYHKNDFGEKCIVDYERCVKLGIIKAAAPEEEDAEEETPRPPRKKKSTA